MSTLTLQRGEKDPDLSDKVPEVKSSLALQQEPKPVENILLENDSTIYIDEDTETYYETFINYLKSFRYPYSLYNSKKTPLSPPGLEG